MQPSGESLGIGAPACVNGRQEIHCMKMQRKSAAIALTVVLTPVTGAPDTRPVLAASASAPPILLEGTIVTMNWDDGRWTGELGSDDAAAAVHHRRSLVVCDA